MPGLTIRQACFKLFRSEYKLDKLTGSGGGLYLFLVLLGDKILAWQSDRLWLSLDFLAADDIKSISINVFCLFLVFGNNGENQYAFQNKIEAKWVQTSVKPTMEVQWAETTVLTSSARNHSFSGG